jgi:uncharacterized membrane protein (Fun14 family)
MTLAASRSALAAPRCASRLSPLRCRGASSAVAAAAAPPQRGAVIAWRAARLALGGCSVAAVFLQDVAHCAGNEDAAEQPAAAAAAGKAGLPELLAQAEQAAESGAAAAAAAVSAAAAAATGGSNGGGGADGGAWDVLDALFRKAVELLPTEGGGVIANGAIVGYCSAIALREVGRAAAAALGFVFLLFQGAASLGYVDINTAKLESDLTARLDMDGDGKLTAEDLRLMYEKAKQMLPSTAGFGAGFALGLLS